MPDATTPAEELELLKQSLNDNQANAAELAKESERLKAQIADLDKTVKEVDQKKKDFEKAAAGADQKKDELLAYVAREKLMIEAAISEAAVVAEKKKTDEAQKALEVALTNAGTDAGVKATALTAAKKTTAEKQAAFGKIAGRAAANDDIFKDLAKLRAAADNQSSANNLARTYYLVLVIEERLGELDLIAPAAHAQQLNAAGKALAGAAEAERAAKEASDAAAQIEKQARKDLETFRTKSRQATLDAIQEGAGNAPMGSPTEG